MLRALVAEKDEIQTSDSTLALAASAPPATSRLPLNTVEAKFERALQPADADCHVPTNKRVFKSNDERNRRRVRTEVRRGPDGVVGGAGPRGASHQPQLVLQHLHAEALAGAPGHGLGKRRTHEKGQHEKIDEQNGRLTGPR